MTTPRAAVRRFVATGSDNYQYVLEHAGRALAVDPRGSAMVRELETTGLEPVGILVTHPHWDHVDGIPVMLEHWPDLPVYAHHDALPDLPNQARHEAVAEGDRIAFGDTAIEVSELPGHHPAHVGLLWQDLLLIGDVLFLAGCGNPNFGGDLEALTTTVLERLAGYDDDVVLAWGHDYAERNLAFALEVDPENPVLRSLAGEIAALASGGRDVPWRTLGEERSVNPFLRTNRPELYDSLVRAGYATGTDERAVFRALRTWRDAW